ncbi:sialic acid-binding Ig-like lectin 7 [Trichomycterus rosablanca]|uniref:sialic acid-binding Ig-like lectin 7 n=1 Tax=Trichomycterus rosablanca TaxID=2290929 RepID=UPI002F360778
MNITEKPVFAFCLLQAVLCGDFSIDLPQSIEALSGICVLVPCSFDIEPQHEAELQRDPKGIWYKNGSGAKSKVFSSKSTEENLMQGKMTGELSKKNCTTIFYNLSEADRTLYFFRIVSGNLKYIYVTPVFINVTASPISPSVTLYKENQVEAQRQNEVLEGASVSLVCSARSPCPSNRPIFIWSFLPKETTLEQNHNVTFSSSTLNFRASRVHHGLSFICIVTYQLENGGTKSAQSSVTLRVLYAPKNTTVVASPSPSVLLGTSVILSCSSDANPAVLNFIWYRTNGEQIGTGNHLIIKNTDETHHGLYYCRAQNQHGDQNSSIYLNLQYAPQVSLSSSCNGIQDWIVCFCEVRGNPSPKLEWRLSGEPLSSETMWVESVNDSSVRSFIPIHQSYSDALPTLQCVGTNKLGIDTHSLNPLVLGNAILLHWPYLVLHLYVVVPSCVVLLLCLIMIGFLIYRLNRLSGKVRVLKRGVSYTSLQLCPQVQQANTEREVKEYKA